MASNAPGRASHRFLARSPDWAAVYWSEAAIVYVDRRAHGDLDRFAYRLIDPTAVVESVQALAARGSPELFPRLESELFRLLEGDPKSLRAHVALLAYYDTRGPAFHAKRDEVLARLQSLAPDHPVVKQIGMRLHAPRR